MSFHATVEKLGELQEWDKHARDREELLGAHSHSLKSRQLFHLDVGLMKGSDCANICC